MIKSDFIYKLQVFFLFSHIYKNFVKSTSQSPVFTVYHTRAFSIGYCNGIPVQPQDYLYSIMGYIIANLYIADSLALCELKMTNS